jgi:antitoxin (DNA-binding transcriptional repressor) of toxin-antitoxin stability system
MKSIEIVDALERGESFVVTRDGVPVAELRAVQRRRFVTTEALVAAFRGAPPVDGARFRADVDRHVDARLSHSTPTRRPPA